LHQLAGNSEDLVIEVHGSLYEVECLSCGTRSAMSDTLERVAAGEEDPACLRCGGILKAGTISFGQPLVPSVLAAARDAVLDCDLLLIVGTSLVVRPVADLVELAVQRGVRVVIINAEPTPYDELAAAKITEPISQVLPRIVQTALSLNTATT
jgi:NAD-dependent deacetylase